MWSQFSTNKGSAGELLRLSYCMHMQALGLVHEGGLSKLNLHAFALAFVLLPRTLHNAVASESCPAISCPGEGHKAASSLQPGCHHLMRIPECRPESRVCLELKTPPHRQQACATHRTDAAHASCTQAACEVRNTITKPTCLGAIWIARTFDLSIYDNCS